MARLEKTIKVQTSGLGAYHACLDFKWENCQALLDVAAQIDPSGFVNMGNGPAMGRRRSISSARALVAVLARARTRRYWQP